MAKRQLSHIAERVFNTPLLIEDAKLDVILSVLAPRLGLATSADAEMQIGEVEKRDIYSVSESGIAVLDISGTLVNRKLQGVEALSGLTSYEEISAELDKAEMPAVRGLILRMHSPGGEAAGVGPVADQIARIAESKPVWASIDDYAFSAGYWLASAANRIYTTETGGVGSIGGVAKHVDKSKFNEKAGFTVTTVFSGEHKADFNTDEPLSGAGRERLQAMVDDLTVLFVDAVAKNRRMAKKAVRDTKALTYQGQKGIDAGLADRMGTFREVIAQMEAMLGRGKREDIPAVITQKKSEDRNAPKRQGIEFRQLPIVELRADGGEEPVITGHIAVFDQWSIDIGGFVERISPGAFSKTLQESDIHHFWNHDGNIVLGRNKSGTLQLREDATGLYIENQPPNTQTVRDLVLEPIRRGDVDQGSFAFLPTRQEWGRHDGKLARTLHEVRLFHTAIVPHGAYPQTDVGLRAASEDIDLYALGVIDAKRRHKVPLSTEEGEFLKATLGKLTCLAPVTPGLAAHLTDSATKPPTPLDTLRLRLELARRRAAA